MNNLRDLLGYALVRHRRYGYCRFVTNVFSHEDTLVSRICERFYQEEEF